MARRAPSESSLLQPRSALETAPETLTRILLGQYAQSMGGSLSPDGPVHRSRSAAGASRPLSRDLHAKFLPYTMRVEHVSGSLGVRIAGLSSGLNPDDRPFAEQVNYAGESLHIPFGLPTSMATVPTSSFTHILRGKSRFESRGRVMSGLGASPIATPAYQARPP